MVPEISSKLKQKKMPYVNFKYKLEKDATVTVAHIRVEDQTAPSDHEKSANLYEGKIKKIYVDNAVNLDVVLSGMGGKWKFEGFVRELVNGNPENETGDWKPLDNNSDFDFELADRNTLVATETIKWA
jgi:hypothetical protein